MEIEVSRHVNAPAQSVWEIITDLKAWPEVIAAIKSVEVLSGPGEFAEGTRWRETRTMFGREASEEMRVSAIDPGTSYSTVAASNGVEYESRIMVVPVGDDDSNLSMTFSGHPTTPVSRLMAVTVGRLFAGSTRKALAAELDDVARVAESRHGAAGNESGGRPVGP